MYVAEGLDPQRPQAALGRPVEPHVHQVAAQRGQQHGDRGGGDCPADDAEVRAARPGDAVVDHLLDDDGDDDAATCGSDRKESRDGETLTKLR